MKNTRLRKGLVCGLFSAAMIAGVGAPGTAFAGIIDGPRIPPPPEPPVVSCHVFAGPAYGYLCVAPGNYTLP